MLRAVSPNPCGLDHSWSLASHLQMGLRLWEMSQEMSEKEGGQGVSSHPWHASYLGPGHEWPYPSGNCGSLREPLIHFCGSQWDPVGTLASFCPSLLVGGYLTIFRGLISSNLPNSVNSPFIKDIEDPSWVCLSFLPEWSIKQIKHIKIYWRCKDTDFIKFKILQSSLISSALFCSRAY